MISRPRQSGPRPNPRLYLITPLLTDVAAFSSRLISAVEAGDIAAVLLRLAEADERTQINRAKTMSEIIQERDVALLLETKFELVARAGADGVHLSGAATFLEAAERLKPERIVGAGGLASRHDAMLVAQGGADYVMFGEPDAAGRCPSFAAVTERVAWWAEVFEIPCIGYAPSLDNIAPLVTAGADFVALSDAAWTNADRIVETIREAEYRLGLSEPTT